MDKLEAIKNELRYMDKECDEKGCCECSYKKICDDMCHEIGEFVPPLDILKYIEKIEKH